MRVVHIAHTYGDRGTGGAAIALTRLHRALLAAGVDSHVICVTSVAEDRNVYSLPKIGWLRNLIKAVNVFLFRLRYVPALKDLYKCPVVPFVGLEKEVRRLKPDVIHVHWVNWATLTYEQLSRLPKNVDPCCRFFVNLHDFNAINAIEPHMGEDKRFQFGFTKSNSSIFERWNFARKNRTIETLKPTFIGPSVYCRRICEVSYIGRSYPCYVVSNLMDSVFHYEESKRTRFPKFIILFGAARDNPYKGWEDLMSAVEQIPSEVACQMEIHVFGECFSDYESHGVMIKALGIKRSAIDLLDVYHTGDVFAFPSILETQGMTKCEALLCGLPVLVFDRTACAEMIDHGKNGWIAKSIAEYADGILHYYRLWKNREIAYENIAEDVKEALSCRMILNKILKLYFK